MTSPSEVVVGSLNAHFGRTVEGDVFDLSVACRALNSEVIALQETWEPRSAISPVQLVATELGMSAVTTSVMTDTDLHSHGIAMSRQPEYGDWGLAILTSLEMTDPDVLDLGRAPGDITQRKAQAVTITLCDGRPFRLVNTHLTHRLSFSPGQLRRVRRWTLGWRLPTVIVGDLNAVWPVTAVCRGFRRTARGATWSARGFPVQLDHLLVGRGVTWRDAAVLEPVGSDHRPLRVHLRIGHDGGGGPDPHR
jgi:endonuclease/exonuclease/phosphatase family metal-dependent hydrolase